MRCPSCGFDNPSGMKFCGECGVLLMAFCPACGFTNPPPFKFCDECGASIGPPSLFASPPTLAAQPQPPSRYTPAYLAEKILTSKSALEGERKQVTVLFADLKGSMELLADRDPEEARQLLDPVLERMMDAAHRYERTVNQVMGDGIMALFGAPMRTMRCGRAMPRWPCRRRFSAIAQVLTLLRSRGRVPYRALKLQLQLDDEALEAIKDELIYAQHVAADEEGRMLVWTAGDSGTPAPPQAHQDRLAADSTRQPT
jgi:Double zinc ribbon/Adenylate and Guanylate cyclase catalytic domain